MCNFTGVECVSVYLIFIFLNLEMAKTNDYK